jgi:hypothetical protein
MRIEIAEIENRNIYRVWHDGAVIIERTATPMRTAARVLLARGADPDDVLELVRRGRDQVDLRARIADVALLGGHTDADEGNADHGGLSDSPETREATRPAFKRPLRPSESDDCETVVAVLDETRRVISDGVLQWILQTREAHRWKSRSYCRTKEALIRCCGGSTPELDALPDRIGDRIAPTTDAQEAAE